MVGLLNKYYYKTRIIFTFAAISILLVLLMSRGSYYFVKDLYMQQLEDQLNIISNVLTEDLDFKMIELLDLGKPTSSLTKYLETTLNKRSFEEFQSDIFVFDNTLEINYSAQNPRSTMEHPELGLFADEIELLGLNEKMTSTPFLGVDDQWYLFSFNRIGNNTYLGIKALAVNFNKIEEFDNLFWLLGLIGIIIIVIISWFLANSITKPIDRLVEFSSAIGDNKLEIRAPENMKGELGILNKAMDMMRNNILRNQKDREKMLAQIAHEIRNPLGGIELLAGLTKEDLLKNNLPYHYQEKILNEVSGLKVLISSYLNYSKPSPANPEVVDLESLVNDVTNSTQSKLNSKNIDLRTRIDLGHIKFDKDQLKHILINLIINAADAVDNSGSIEISTWAENGFSIIAVRDNGCGIPDQDTEKLFELFYTTKKDGVGLGLAISKKYCLENNSELLFELNKPNGVVAKIIKEK